MSPPRFVIVILVGICLAAGTPGAQSEDFESASMLRFQPPRLKDVLTLAELEHMALGANPALAVAAARVEAARGRWLQVGLKPNPVVGYAAEEIGEGGSAGKQGGFVRQQVVTAGKLKLRRAEAAMEVEKAEHAWHAAQLRVLTDVRSIYYTVLAAQRRVELASQLVDLGNQAVDTAKALRQALTVSQIDVLQAQVEAGRARVQLQKARAQYEQAWKALAAVIGAPHLAPTPLAGKLDEHIPEIIWDEAIGRLLAESPQRARALAETERARWGHQRAHAEGVPDFDVEVGVLGNTANEDTLVNVSLSVPLPLFDRNQGELHRTHAQISAAEMNVARLELFLHKQLADVYHRYEAARQQAREYQNNILPGAQEALNLTHTAYEAGQIGYLPLLTAQQAYFSASLASIDALQDLWTAAMEIKGLLLSESLTGD